MNLDAQVATKILGWYRDSARRGPLSDWHEPKCGGKGRCAPSCGFTLRAYSTEIAAAFVVVEKMRANGWSFACTLYEGELPYASFCRKTVATSRKAEASTLPEAICRAALKAINSILKDQHQE